MAEYISPDAHWRDSARSVRFFIVDYRATFPLLVVLFFPRVNTLIIAGITIGFFALLERYGFTVSVFGRWLRVMLAGPKRIARPWWVKSKYP